MSWRALGWRLLVVAAFLMFLVPPVAGIWGMGILFALWAGASDRLATALGICFLPIWFGAFYWLAHSVNRPEEG